MQLAFIIWQCFYDVGASPPGTSWKSIKAIKVLSDVINVEPTKIWSTSEVLAHRWQALHPIKNFLSPQTYCSCKRWAWTKCHSLNDKAEDKRSVSDGFINDFSVHSVSSFWCCFISQEDSLHRLSALLWLLVVRPVLEPIIHNHCVGLRGALQPSWLHKPSQDKRTSPHCIFSLKHLFTIFMSTQKVAFSSAAAVILSF